MYRIIGADGKEYGPVTTEQLRQWMAEGRVNEQTRVQIEGGAGWQPLGSFPEFHAPISSSPPVARRPMMTEHVPNHLAPAILCTVFCCLPFGIPAIVFAAQVNSKLTAGDVIGAREASRKAKMWCWVSFWLGLVAPVIWVVVMLSGVLMRNI
jgi:hypothetical protein